MPAYSAVRPMPTQARGAQERQNGKGMVDKLCVCRGGGCQTRIAQTFLKENNQFSLQVVTWRPNRAHNYLSKANPESKIQTCIVKLGIFKLTSSRPLQGTAFPLLGSKFQAPERINTNWKNSCMTVTRGACAIETVKRNEATERRCGLVRKNAVTKQSISLAVSAPCSTQSQRLGIRMGEKHIQDNPVSHLGRYQTCCIILGKGINIVRMSCNQ